MPECVDRCPTCQQAILADGLRLPIDLGPLQLTPATYGTVIYGRIVALTRTEFEMLYFLALRAFTVVDKEAIFRAVWGEDSRTDSKIVDTYVFKLRNKLGLPPDSFLKTHWGKGVSIDLRG